MSTASVKHDGASVMIWDNILASDAWNAVKIYGITNAERYRQVSIHLTVPSGKCMISNNYIFQHDNDPTHTANAVRAYLVRKTHSGAPSFISWLLQSPDFNLTETMWDHLNTEKKKANI